MLAYEPVYRASSYRIATMSKENKLRGVSSVPKPVNKFASVVALCMAGFTVFQGSGRSVAREFIVCLFFAVYFARIPFEGGNFERFLMNLIIIFLI